jgi:ABC-2 type transport system ATP-binding protein
MPIPAIQAEGLTKIYKTGDPPAVAGLDFTQPAGSTWALLGGNGAGKSTTIAMLLGLLVPRRG